MGPGNSSNKWGGKAPNAKSPKLCFSLSFYMMCSRRQSGWFLVSSQSSLGKIVFLCKLRGVLGQILAENIRKTESCFFRPDCLQVPICMSKAVRSHPTPPTFEGSSTSLASLTQ